MTLAGGTWTFPGGCWMDLCCECFIAGPGFLMALGLSSQPRPAEGFSPGKRAASPRNGQNACSLSTLGLGLSCCWMGGDVGVGRGTRARGGLGRESRQGRRGRGGESTGVHCWHDWACVSVRTLGCSKSNSEMSTNRVFRRGDSSLQKIRNPKGQIR